MNEMPRRFTPLHPLAYIGAIILLWFIIYCFEKSGFNSRELYLGERLTIMLSFIRELFPPSFERINSVGASLMETFRMAVAGSVAGIIISIPLCILAARNFTPNKAVYTIVRFIISLFRTIPDLIWALFFVITVGLGPLAGTLTLIIDTIGFCGRFFAEAVEEVDTAAVDGMKAIGAGKTATIFCAVFPATLPSFTNTALFNLEKTVRSSVALGLVGAGGIGIELKTSMETLRYAEASTVIGSIFIMVLVVERISGWIRKRII